MLRIARRKVSVNSPDQPLQILSCRRRLGYFGSMCLNCSTKSAADVEGPWIDVDPAVTSGLIERCKAHWDTPVDQLPDVMLATFLGQKIALIATIPEAQHGWIEFILMIQSSTKGNSPLHCPKHIVPVVQPELRWARRDESQGI